MLSESGIPGPNAARRYCRTSDERASIVVACAVSGLAVVGAGGLLLDVSASWSAFEPEDVCDRDRSVPYR